MFAKQELGNTKQTTHQENKTWNPVVVPLSARGWLVFVCQLLFYVIVTPFATLSSELLALGAPYATQTWILEGNKCDTR